MIDYRFANHLTVIESKLAPAGEIAYLKAVFPAASPNEKPLASLHYWDGTESAPHVGDEIIVTVFTREQWDQFLLFSSKTDDEHEVLDSPSA